LLNVTNISNSFIFSPLTNIPSIQRSGSAFLEFYRTSPNYGTIVSVGELGSPEANLAFNMNYSDGVHRYYNSSYNSIWLALGSYGWAMQFASTGRVPDIWYDDGARYLVYQSGNGRMILDTSSTLVSSGIFNATLTVPPTLNGVSIAGTSEIKIEGNQQKGVPGSVYLNGYNNGTVFIGFGGGNVIIGNNSYNKNVGIGTTSPSAKLDINGTMKLMSAIEPTCNSTTAGTIYYNSTTNKHRGCNSTTWNDLY